MKLSMDTIDYVTVDFLRDSLYRKDDILLLDCRSNEEYGIGHITGSHNIVLPQLMMRRLKANKLSLKSLVPPNYNQGKEAFLTKCTTYQVILYDDVSSDVNNNDLSMLNLLYKRMKNEGCSVVALKGGYKKFEDNYPDFCVISGSPFSSDADDEDCASDDSRGGRFSPVSPLSGIAPTILGLGALHISCDSKETDNANFQNSRSGINANRDEDSEHLKSTCARHNRTINNNTGFKSITRLPDVKSKSGPNHLSACSGCTCKKDSPNPVYPSPCGYVNAASPAEILPGLFLGCAKDAASQETLNRFNISYILNVTPNLPNVFEDSGAYKYKQIPITDHWSQNLSQFFPEAISFIEEARDGNCGVLVHCLAGISRSVTVTVAYLMQKMRWSLNDAYDFVKQRKSNVSPNFNFMGQLLDFEKTLGVGDYSSTDDSAVSSASSGASTPPTLFFTSPPPPTPTLSLPIRKSNDMKFEERAAFILPTSVA